MADIQKQIGVNAVVQEKELGQIRPSDTTATSIYSPPSTVISTEIKSIFVANNTAGAIAFRLFLDQDGTTYDQSTALYYDESIAANTTKEINLSIFMTDSSGNLAGRSATGNALTFTAYGVEMRRQA